MRKILLLSMLLVTGCGNESNTTSGGKNSIPNNKTAAAQSKDYHLVLEAEAAVIGAPFKVAEEKGVSGGNYLRIPIIGKDQKTKAWKDPSMKTGRAELAAEIPANGEARVWFRTYWGGTCSNSAKLVLPSGAQQTIGGDETYKVWHWVRAPRSLTLKKGSQTFSIRPREDNIGIDQIIVTTDKEFVPQGIESE